MDVKEIIEQQGYLTIADALAPQQIAKLVATIDELIGNEPDGPHNVKDILGRHNVTLALVRIATVLRRVTALPESSIRAHLLQCIGSMLASNHSVVRTPNANKMAGRLV